MPEYGAGVVREYNAGVVGEYDADVVNRVWVAGATLRLRRHQPAHPIAPGRSEPGPHGSLGALSVHNQV